MKKFFALLLILVALLTPLFFCFTSVEAEDALTINDIAVSGGVNLLNLDDGYVELTGTTLKTTRKIFIPKENTNYIAIPFDNVVTSKNPSIKVTYFDIDFNQLGEQRIALSNGLIIGTDLFYGALNIPDYAFSFDIMIGNINGGLASLGVEIINSSDTSNIDPYKKVDYVETLGFVELLKTPTVKIEVSFDEPYDEDDILSLIEFIDGGAGDLKSELVVDSSKYLENKDTIGSYPIDIYLKKKESDNFLGTFDIVVVNKNGPIITGPDFIEVDIGTVVDKDYILENGFKIEDDYDTLHENIIEIIVESSLENTSTIADGTLTIKAISSTEKVATKEINLYVKDLSSPELVRKSENIEIAYNYSQDILTLIPLAFEISDNYDQNPTVTVVTDNYTPNKRLEGSYLVEIKVTDQSLNYKEGSFYVTVLDDIPPVLFLNAYKIETSTNVILTKDDIVQTLRNTGVLSKDQSYNIKVLKDTYTGNENKVGTYTYLVRCEREDGDVLVKTLEINVSDNDFYDKELVVIEEPSDFIDPTRIIIITAVITTVVIGIPSFVSTKKKKKTK